MFEIAERFSAEIQNQPQWVQIWLNFLGPINFVAVLFVFKSRLPWIVLGAIVISFILMMLLYDQYGYVKLLGLPHILVWTPMLIYFWRVVPKLPTSWMKKYLYVLMGANFISLLFDYVDVARYFLGMV